MKALLSLSVRGSSCRWREPGSANTHTETAENKMCGGASLPSLSGARGARCDSFHCHLSVVVVESPAGVWPGKGMTVPRRWERALSSWLVGEMQPPPCCPPMPSTQGGTEEKPLTSAAAVSALERCLCGE